ncbi:MAG: stage sporulation protein [Clostridia bacterium]|nr:stage sporulation protein [Clostridia bacterium]
MSLAGGCESMLKILGGGLIIISCGLWGLMIAQDYKARIEQLRQLSTGLKMLETEIIYTATPLSEAFEKIGNQFGGPISLFFQTVAKELKANVTAGAMVAWEKGLEQLRDKGALWSQDLEILKELGSMLGQSGINDQVKNLELTRNLLGQQQLEAIEFNSRKGKMWHTLGFLFGITLVLILY